MVDYLFKIRLLFLATGFAGILVSIYLHVKNKTSLLPAVLILTAFFIFLFAALLSPFLNVWDERFHALVARNMMHHPLMPTLYDDPVVNMLYDRWDRYHIWLHKQPLFLWQSAVSFMIFGINELSFRLPSILLGCLLVFAGYRSGTILGNKNIGFYTAFLILTSYHLIGLVSGYEMLDQNDFTFLAYISLSIWSYLEYRISKSKTWLIITGCFAGFAILVKWLVGLIIYEIWFLDILFSGRKEIKRLPALFVSLLVALVISVPWQVFIFMCYPNEAKASYDNNINHVLVPLDGHGGTFTYHFNIAPQVFGLLIPIMVIPGFYLFYKKSSMPSIAAAFIISILTVYLFFSFTATKMPSFTTVIIVPVYIAAAFFMDYLSERLASVRISKPFSQLLLFLILGTVVFFRIDVRALDKRHNLFTRTDQRSNILYRNKIIFRKLNLPSNAVIFNVPGRHYIEAMFYTGLPSYNFIPDEKEFIELKKKKRIVAMFKQENDTVPAYLKNDPDFMLIDQVLRQGD